MKQSVPLYFVAITAMSVAGCAVGPEFIRPKPPVTLGYTQEVLPPVLVSADGATQRFVLGAMVVPDWWTVFGSPEINAAVRRALENNPSLQAAQASLRQSQDSMRAGYGVFYPQIHGDGAISRQRTGLSQQGSLQSGRIVNLYTLSGTVSYALDVFGGSRRNVEGLQAQADAQRHTTQAAYLTLSANVVNACIAGAAYSAQIQATEQLLVLEKEELEAVKALERGGTAPDSDVLVIKSLISANQALLAPLRQRNSQTSHLLSMLEGQLPSEGRPLEIQLAALTVATNLPLSLPSELVRQRPDILAIEAHAQAASAKIGVATAAMLPSFSLSAGYGASGSSAGNLFGASGNFWNIGPAVTIPVFQGTSLWFGRRAAQDAYLAAMATYRQTVNEAFLQVADSLSALQHDAEGLAAQVETMRVSSESLALVQTSYRAGLVPFVSVLAADIQFHQATLGYIDAVTLRHQDSVALFTALGGGLESSRQAVAR